MMTFRCLITLVCFVSFSVSSMASSRHFPVKGEMRNRVNFWKKVYTEINSYEAFIHDSENPDVIYSRVVLPKTNKERFRQVKKEVRRVKKALRSIIKKNKSNLTAFEQILLKPIKNASIVEIREYERRVRYQYGLKDNYYLGLVRSYRYMDFIKKTFSRLNLPKELIYLPHVESSFNYNAYSKVGAAGIWQFMRSTGRRFGLKVGYIIDERRDPIKATVSAARLLKQNYALLKSWPLALTAYNHGPRSIQRAVEKLGTRDINKIIEGYEGRRFKFASKNFYATFMATVEISKNPERYFPAFKKPRPESIVKLKLDRPYMVKDLAKAFKVEKSFLKKYNPSIRNVVYRSELFIPKGFEIKVPSRMRNKLEGAKKRLASINYGSFKSHRLHRISRGENLYDISRLYKTSMHKIISFNNIDNPRRIFPGQVLKIPGAGAKISRKLSSVRAPTKILTNGIKSLVKLDTYNLGVRRINKSVVSVYVEPEETIGHYADWSGQSVYSIKNINHIRRNKFIRLGQRLKLELDSKQLARFKNRRRSFHISHQEDYYSSYTVSGNSVYRVKRGDTLTRILSRKSLPFWLLRKWQTGKRLNSKIFVGQKLVIPKVSRI